MLNVILYPWSDCAIYSGHFIEISTEVEKSHWHHVVSVTLTSKRCNFKIKPQICISTWVLLIIKCFGCPWIFFWGIHGWHDVSVTCCQHEFVSKGCFKLSHLLVHVSIHNNNWSKCLLKLKRPIWKIWCQCDALYQKFANCPLVCFDCGSGSEGNELLSPAFHVKGKWILFKVRPTKVWY